MPTARVLVVEPEEEGRLRLSSWLLAEGYDVLTCAGPEGPTYECPWARGAVCARARLADIVVLDLWLESDTVYRGSTAGEVLLHYRSFGTPVVALADGQAPPWLEPDPRVRVLPRFPEREGLLRTVRSLLREVRVWRDRKAPFT